MTPWGVFLGLLATAPPTWKPGEAIPEAQECVTCHVPKPPEAYQLRTYRSGKRALRKECKQCELARIRKNRKAP